MKPLLYETGNIIEHDKILSNKLGAKVQDLMDKIDYAKSAIDAPWETLMDDYIVDDDAGCNCN